MTFPSTPILDSANRPDEGPPPSAAWDNNLSWFGSGNALEVFNKTFRQAQIGSDGGAFYKTLMPRDQEAYLKIVDTKSIGGKHSGFGLYARANSATGTITDLYEFLASTYDATLNQTTFEINRFNSITGFVAIDSIVVNVILSVGDQIGYRCVSSALEFWYCPDGGAWSIVLSATDANLLSGGYIGVEIFDPPPPSQVAAFDNFGGGAVPAPPIPPGKYTGKDLEVSFGGTAIPCGNVRAVNIDEKTAIEDQTGACDEFMDYLDMRRDVDVSLELLDSTDPTEVYNLFTGLSDSLIIYPLGNHAGKPKLTITEFMITDLSQPIKYTDAVLVNVAGKASGGMVEGVV